MQYVTVFLKLRERLNHSYITPKILMRIEPKPEIIHETFDNPKIWYQIKLRIEFLFHLGENIFKLECPEVFGNIKKKMDAIISKIELFRTVKNEKNCLKLVKYLNLLSKLIQQMGAYEYVLKDNEIEPSIEQEKSNYQMVKSNIRYLGEMIRKALTMNGGWESEFLQLGKTYWETRVLLEELVIRQLVLQDRKSIVSEKKFWEVLFVLIDTDWTAEEALALEATKQDRLVAVKRLMQEKNKSSIEHYFKNIETKLNGFLEVQ